MKMASRSYWNWGFTGFLSLIVSILILGQWIKELGNQSDISMNKSHLSPSIYGPRNLKIRGNVGIFEEKEPERRDLLEAHVSENTEQRTLAW